MLLHPTRIITPNLSKSSQADSIPHQCPTSPRAESHTFIPIFRGCLRVLPLSLPHTSNCTIISRLLNDISSSGRPCDGSGKGVLGQVDGPGSPGNHVGTLIRIIAGLKRASCSLRNMLENGYHAIVRPCSSRYSCEPGVEM